MANKNPEPTPEPQREPQADSARRPIFPDARMVVEAAREAALSGLDGTLALQEEMQKAYTRSLDQFRDEADSWASLVQKAATESSSLGWDVSRRSITVLRDEISRLGKAPSA